MTVPLHDRLTGVLNPLSVPMPMAHELSDDALRRVLSDDALRRVLEPDGLSSTIVCNLCKPNTSAS